MAKIPYPQGNDFMHQSVGGVPQFGSRAGAPLSPQNAEEFQRHMQQLDAEQAKGKVMSPHDLMSGTKVSNFGPPVNHPLSAPAPENFGPPQISKTPTDPNLHFGPPNSNQLDQEHAEVKAKTSPTNTPKPPKSLSKGPNKPPELGTKGGSHDGGPEKMKFVDYSYKKVMQMESNNMLQNAMSHMKFKDPDPDAWQ